MTTRWATALKAHLRKVAKSLCQALDQGKFKSRLWKYPGCTDNGIALYSIPWSAIGLGDVCDVLSAHVLQTWFHDIFQDEAGCQLQGCSDGKEPPDSFSFSLDYGDTWEATMKRERERR
jgi:hypothetical protein